MRRNEEDEELCSKEALNQFLRADASETLESLRVTWSMDSGPSLLQAIRSRFQVIISGNKAHVNEYDVCVLI
jgi:hypothetical protein